MKFDKNHLLVALSLTLMSSTALASGREDISASNSLAPEGVVNSLTPKSPVEGVGDENFGNIGGGADSKAPDERYIESKAYSSNNGSDVVDNSMLQGREEHTPTLNESTVDTEEGHILVLRKILNRRTKGLMDALQELEKNLEISQEESLNNAAKFIKPLNRAEEVLDKTKDRLISVYPDNAQVINALLMQVEDFRPSDLPSSEDFIENIVALNNSLGMFESAGRMLKEFEEKAQKNSPISLEDFRINREIAVDLSFNQNILLFTRSNNNFEENWIVKKRINDVLKEGNKKLVEAYSNALKALNDGVDDDKINFLLERVCLGFMQYGDKAMKVMYDYEKQMREIDRAFLEDPVSLVDKPSDHSESSDERLTHDNINNKIQELKSLYGSEINAGQLNVEKIKSDYINISDFIYNNIDKLEQNTILSFVEVREGIIGILNSIEGEVGVEYGSKPDVPAADAVAGAEGSKVISSGGDYNVAEQATESKVYSTDEASDAVNNLVSASHSESKDGSAHETKASGFSQHQSSNPFDRLPDFEFSQSDVVSPSSQNNLVDNNAKGFETSSNLSGDDDVASVSDAGDSKSSIPDYTPLVDALTDGRYLGDFELYELVDSKDRFGYLDLAADNSQIKEIEYRTIQEIKNKTIGHIKSDFLNMIDNLKMIEVDVTEVDESEFKGIWDDKDYLHKEIKGKVKDVIHKINEDMYRVTENSAEWREILGLHINYQKSVALDILIQYMSEWYPDLAKLNSPDNENLAEFNQEVKKELDNLVLKILDNNYTITGQILEELEEKTREFRGRLGDLLKSADAVVDASAAADGNAGDVIPEAPVAPPAPAAIEPVVGQSLQELIEAELVNRGDHRDFEPPIRPVFDVIPEAPVAPPAPAAIEPVVGQSLQELIEAELVNRGENIDLTPRARPAIVWTEAELSAAVEAKKAQYLEDREYYSKAAEEAANAAADKRDDLEQQRIEKYLEDREYYSKAAEEAAISAAAKLAFHSEKEGLRCYIVNEIINLRGAFESLEESLQKEGVEDNVSLELDELAETIIAGKDRIFGVIYEAKEPGDIPTDEAEQFIAKSWDDFTKLKNNLQGDLYGLVNLFGDVEEEVADVDPEEEVVELAPEVEVVELAPEVEVVELAPEVEVVELAPEVEVVELVPEVEVVELVPEVEVVELVPEVEVVVAESIPARVLEIENASVRDTALAINNATNQEELTSAVRSGIINPDLSQASSTDQQNLASIIFTNLSEQDKTQFVATSQKQVNSDEIIATPQEIVKLVGQNITHQTDNLVFAAAAGDEDKDISSGVWISGLYGVNKQGSYKGNSSYKGHIAGFSIGADFGYDDLTRVGFAYSNAQSHFKYKADRQGDKVNAKSDVYSLYGYHNFNDFVVRGIASYVDSKIKVQQVKTPISGVSQLYKAKPKGKAYVFEANLGYNVKATDDIILQPNVGMRYGKYQTNSFTPKAANGSIFSETTQKKSNDILTGIAGVKAMMPYKVSEDTKLTPILSANIEYDFKSKKKNQQTRFAEYLDSTEGLADSSGKVQKLAYNVGASVLLQHKNVEVSANYNCKLQKKYQAHQGSLRLKMMF